MQITANTTPFLAELFVALDKSGRKNCVVVVKATFVVRPDGECQPAAEQVPFTYADQHHGDPGETSIRCECDFVPIKPRPEIVLEASAMARDGRPVRTLEIALQGAGIDKRGRVTGDRVWEEGSLGLHCSEPVPFAAMPLVWDLAFGGSDQSHERVSRRGTDLRNPVGRGFHLNGDTVRGRRLPNIELPGQMMQSWSDQPVPIGFGPVGRGWQPRLGFAGTYDQRWMDERMPLVPEDFDDRYFQSAPLDQQVAKLDPGSAFICRNMSEDGLFTMRLPHVHVPVRFMFDRGVETEVVTPDTLILEPGARRATLLGRARALLPRKSTNLREIQVGAPRRIASPERPRYADLGEALAALRDRQ